MHLPPAGEHLWLHTRRGEEYVTVVIDLTPIRDGTGLARLLDMVEGRSKAVFKTWLTARSPAWRGRVEVVAVDGFTGFTQRRPKSYPGAVAVMDPFSVVRLDGDALDRCQRRVQQELHGHRGLAGDAPYRASGPCTQGRIFSPTGSENACCGYSPSRSTLRSRPPGASISG